MRISNGGTNVMLILNIIWHTDYVTWSFLSCLSPLVFKSQIFTYLHLFFKHDFWCTNSINGFILNGYSVNHLVLLESQLVLVRLCYDKPSVLTEESINQMCIGFVRSFRNDLLVSSFHFVEIILVSCMTDRYVIKVYLEFMLKL